VATKSTTEPQAFIEINGKRYDARTGQVHGASKLVQDVVAVATKPAVALAREPQEPLKPLSSKKLMDVRPLMPRHIKAHKPEHSKTLMRSAVKKPAPTKHLKASTRTDILAKTPQNIVVVPKISFHRTDPKLAAQAERIRKSELIQRFSPSVFTPDPDPTPQELAAVRIQPQHDEPAAPIMDVFTRALERADAHLEKPINHKKAAKAARKDAKRAAGKHKPVHHRTTSLVAASVAVLLLTGFLAYQNKNALEVRYASAQAGFHVNLPQYRPAGYALGKLSYSSGLVSVAFSNDLSHQSFTLSQKPTNWDSQTLQDSLASTAGDAYQSLERGGRTIFMYRDNSATWVSGGVLYELNANGSLSTSQVLDLASSI